MSSTVSYHLPAVIQDFISRESKKESLSRGKFLAQMVESFAALQEEKKYLQGYLKMSTDAEFIQSQIAESEEDLQVEKKYNTSIWAQ